MRFFLVLTMAALLASCQSAYYSAAERVGYHKRDILVNRVEDSRDAQQEAEEQFQSALEQLSTLVSYDGGELESMYKEMAAEYEDSEAAAAEVSERIDAVDDVAGALFDEWQEEIEEYSNDRLKADSQARLRETRQRYHGMIEAMRDSETSMAPVLAMMKDNVMYLKHNLNARAVAALKIEFASIEREISTLLAEMRQSIERSDEFIATMQ